MKNLVYSFSLLLLLSCTKNTTTPAPAASVTAANPANAALSNGLPPNPNALNGVFTAQKMYFPALSYTGYYSYAGLRTGAQALAGLNPFLTITSGNDYGDTLKLNTTVLQYAAGAANGNRTYSDTSSNPSYAGGVSWSLKGNTSFSAINAAITRDFPAISNTGIIPSGFSKSQPLTITFGAGNITNADSISVLISGSSTGFSAYKTVGPAAASVTFSAAELAGAPVGASGNEIFVYTKNYSNMSVNSKTYVFVMHYTLGAFVSITP